ncbi:MAG: DUF5818 domain-containing protein [Candidatus Acidiferrales bacterium]
MSYMKKIVGSLLALSLLIAAAPAAGQGKEQVFKGAIADSQCAMNVHSLSQSHKEMLQGKSVGNSESDCVWYCVTERGGRFVLQNKHIVYKLDKQDLGREYAGRKVEITGTLDHETNTIHVRTIERVEEPPKSAPPVK